ncbi:MAG: SDR family NAD(P)-dependent oxidoreductase [Betaproteobacteria bacterium]|nr:SDR family NAD(P)-dependent oxidoreductase [Betaproteobacteria bacterium]
MNPNPSSTHNERVALITGANIGIGRVTALRLAQAGFTVFLAGRSAQRTQAVIDEIHATTKTSNKAFFLPLQLDDLNSVRECAALFLARQLPLHLLVNNAGLAGDKGQTRQGFEMAFGVNHLGHFLLTQLLLDTLKASAPSRVVTVASRAHLMAYQGLDWPALQEATRSLTGAREYGVSKLANILFSAHLAKVLAGTGVSTYSLHPGVVDTEVWRELPGFLRPLLRLRGLLTPEEGAQTTLYCALQAPAGESGLYYDKSRIKTPSRTAQDAQLAEQLWHQSLQWVKAQS